MKKSKKKSIAAEESTTQVIETFSPVSPMDITSWQRHDRPSAFNGWVRFEKYRITIEKIEESKEVYQERLQKLWEECDSHHHVDPIQAKARILGIELIGQHGSRAKDKKKDAWG